MGPFVKWCSAALICLLLVFPQLPLQFRYLGAITLVLCLLQQGIWHAPGVKLLTTYTVYICLVGVAVVMFANDGSIGNALYPIRTLSFGVLVMLFCRNARISDVVVVMAVVMVGGFTGLVLDHFRPPARSHLPFPIFSEDNLEIMGELFLKHERRGGFTFEAGVIGGVTSFFVILCTALFLILVGEPRLRVPFYCRPLLIAGIVLGLSSFGLIQTKSGLFVLVPAFITLGIGALFFGRRVAPSVQIVGVAIISIIALMLPITYFASQGTALGQYFEAEIDNISKLAGYGFMGKDDGSGLATRIEYAKLALTSLMSRPFGGGMTDGRFFTEFGISAIQPTAEMEAWFAIGRYNGYKGAIFNMLSFGGIISAIVLWKLMGCIVEHLSTLGKAGGAIVGPMIVVSLLFLGLTVELLPYIELIMLSIGIAWIVQRELVAIDTAQLTSVRPSLPHHQQVRNEWL
jgi:hypothetical protein